MRRCAADCLRRNRLGHRAARQNLIATAPRRTEQRRTARVRLPAGHLREPGLGAVHYRSGTEAHRRGLGWRHGNPTFDTGVGGGRRLLRERRTRRPGGRASSTAHLRIHHSRAARTGGGRRTRPGTACPDTAEKATHSRVPARSGVAVLRQIRVIGLLSRLRQLPRWRRLQHGGGGAVVHGEGLEDGGGLGLLLVGEVGAGVLVVGAEEGGEGVADAVLELGPAAGFLGHVAFGLGDGLGDRLEGDGRVVGVGGGGVDGGGEVEHAGVEGVAGAAFPAGGGLGAGAGEGRADGLEGVGGAAPGVGGGHHLAGVEGLDHGAEFGVAELPEVGVLHRTPFPSSCWAGAVVRA